MKHRSAVARWLRKKTVRVALLLFGVAATLAMAPYVLLSSVLFLSAPWSSAGDRFQNIAYLGVGFAGLLGIVGAWLRTLVQPERLSSSRKLRVATSLLLSSGIAAAAILTASLSASHSWPLAVLFSIVLLVGIALLIGTLGEAPHAP